MAGVTITINDAVLQGVIDRMLERMSDLSPVMDSVGKYLARANYDRFETQRSPEGVPWEPLKPETVKRKGIDKILMETSQMRGTIAHQPGRDHVIVGTVVAYAAIHQFGGDITRHAQSRVVRLRTINKKGDLLRQTGYPNLAVFARTAGDDPHKRYTERRATIPQYTITMPARPFLGVSRAEMDHIIGIISGWMQG